MSRLLIVIDPDPGRILTRAVLVFLRPVAIKSWLLALALIVCSKFMEGEGLVAGQYEDVLPPQKPVSG